MKGWPKDDFGRGYAEKGDVEQYDAGLGYDTPFGSYKLSMIAEHIFEISGMASTKKILEIASGTGELALRFAKKSEEVVCSDMSTHMVNISKKKSENLQIKNIRFVIADALNLPFNDDTFDIVIERGISLLIYDKFLEDGTAQSVLDEMKRVSKDKVIIIHQNRCPFLFFKKKTSYHYLREKELKKMLSDVGLDHIKITYVSYSVPLLFNLFGEAKLKRMEKIMQKIPFVKIFGGGIIARGESKKH